MLLFVPSRRSRRSDTCSEGAEAVDTVPVHLRSEPGRKTSKGLNEGDTYRSGKRHGVADDSHDALWLPICQAQSDGPLRAADQSAANIPITSGTILTQTLPGSKERICSVGGQK